MKKGLRHGYVPQAMVSENNHVAFYWKSGIVFRTDIDDFYPALHCL